MSQRERIRKSARSESFRQPRALIYVVHEGELTEPQYLKGLERACRQNRVELKLAQVSGNPRYYVVVPEKRCKYLILQWLVRLLYGIISIVNPIMA